MPAELAKGYKSKAQQARVVSEAWGREELFCANCESAALSGTSLNSRAIDFICPRCAAPYQLKAMRGRIGATIGDGAFTAMVAAMRADRAPNLFVMGYDWPTWRVRDLILIPSFAFPESAVIKRKPLAATARRAGWIGCHIDLRRIAPDARIPVVAGCQPVPSATVRACYERLKPLRKIKAETRGWTWDVLNAVRQLGKVEFTTLETYEFARELERLHPDNRHVRDKIRQQLQVLRDCGLLLHVARGRWRLT